MEAGDWGLDSKTRVGRMGRGRGWVGGRSGGRGRGNGSGIVMEVMRDGGCRAGVLD